MNIYELTQDEIKELITYDPISGKAYWNYRELKWFEDGGKFHPATQKQNGWNARFANIEIKSKNNTGSITLKFFVNTVHLHRLIWFYMTGEWPDIIDHINGNRSDNRWCNLRNVTQFENMKNRKICSNNTSGCMGVIWHKRARKWEASIRVNSKRKSLGYFDAKEEAIMIRKAAEIEYGYHENHGRIMT